MNLNTYREMIDELDTTKNLEKDIREKKGLEDFEIMLKKNLRSQEIQNKLKNLYDNREFIGYICIASQFIEFKIREIILQSQQLAALLRKNFRLDKNWEEKTLGGLITILEKHCINDSALIKQLKDFNNLRVRAIHKLFDTAFEINDVEREIEAKLTPSFSYYNNIVAPLERYRYGITIKFIEAKNKTGQMPQEANMIIKKLRNKIEAIDPGLKDEYIINNVKL